MADRTPLQDYREAVELAESHTVRSLIMAVMLNEANPRDIEKARQAYPWIWEEITRRRFEPGGMLATDVEGTAAADQPALTDLETVKR